MLVRLEATDLDSRESSDNTVSVVLKAFAGLCVMVEIMLDVDLFIGFVIRGSDPLPVTPEDIEPVKPVVTLGS